MRCPCARRGRSIWNTGVLHGSTAKRKKGAGPSCQEGQRPATIQIRAVRSPKDGRCHRSPPASGKSQEWPRPMPRWIMVQRPWRVRSPRQFGLPPQTPRLSAKGRHAEVRLAHEKQESASSSRPSVGKRKVPCFGCKRRKGIGLAAIEFDQEEHGCEEPPCVFF
jgi:hypothetical protein